MFRIIRPLQGLAGVMRPAERRLAILFQPVRRFGKMLNSSQTWIAHSGLGLGLPRISQPKRGMVNRPLRLKKMPTDYPLLTGSEHWRRKARMVFQRMDANADGYLTKEDYVSTAQTLIDHLSLTGEKAERILKGRLELWAAIAGDKTRLSAEEHWRNNLALLNGVFFRQEMYRTLICTEFSTMDIDGDGFISKDEHAAYYYSLDIPTECSKDDFDIMDTNGDGLVSIDEFAESFLGFWLTEDSNNIYNQNFGHLVIDQCD
ncbi:sarcoplasmic calcium-binding protein [Lingula anatina]|uniref:Sarcoplasmic calcium-binding protein n=1 Tax=Lingula anatina TaxID=7574 RepID=A0A1S3IMJ9_LINAN|nr:sarcoplasmic calcium-binding protein [Lingula anatina]|eukprot:XP_013398759.2 sarcoplasmic calcium-binding protein [Lingula anatina]